MTGYGINVNAIAEETLAIWGYGPKSGITDVYKYLTLHNSVFLKWNTVKINCNTNYRLEKCGSQLIFDLFQHKEY